MPEAPAPAALTRADREAMLKSVDKLILSLVRRSGLPPREHEDAAQDVRLLLWGLTEKYDPARGTKWATYAHKAVCRMLSRLVGNLRSKHGSDVQVQDWNAFVVAESLYATDPGAPTDTADTADELFTAVRRQLTAGLLDATAAKPSKHAKPAALPARAIVEGVAFGGLTCDQLATQAGQQVKVVKSNLKNCIRKLKRLGLTQHVATDAEVDAVLAGPSDRYAPRPADGPASAHPAAAV